MKLFQTTNKIDKIFRHDAKQKQFSPDPNYNIILYEKAEKKMDVNNKLEQPSGTRATI